MYSIPYSVKYLRYLRVDKIKNAKTQGPGMPSSLQKRCTDCTEYFRVEISLRSLLTSTYSTLLAIPWRSLKISNLVFSFATMKHACKHENFHCNKPCMAGSGTAPGIMVCLKIVRIEAENHLCLSARLLKYSRPPCLIGICSRCDLSSSQYTSHSRWQPHPRLPPPIPSMNLLRPDIITDQSLQAKSNAMRLRSSSTRP